MKEPIKKGDRVKLDGGLTPASDMNKEPLSAGYAVPHQVYEVVEARTFVTHKNIQLRVRLLRDIEFLRQLGRENNEYWVSDRQVVARKKVKK